MSSILNRDNIIPVLMVSFILGGLTLANTVERQGVKINRLEKDQMSREVIETQLNNIEKKLDENKEESIKFYEKLVEHIEDTKIY